LWLIAGEYGITPAKRIFWPNHLLLEAGLLQAAPPGSEMLWSFERSKAWACVESQHSHVYLQEPDERLRREVAELLASQPGIAEVLTREELNRYDLDHCRAGDLVVISAEDCWQSPLLQCDEQAAVQRAAWTLVEGNAVPPWRQFPGASAQRPSGLGIHGTYGAPPRSPDQRGVLLSRTAGVFPQVDTGDVDLADLILRQFGL